MSIKLLHSKTKIHKNDLRVYSFIYTLLHWNTSPSSNSRVKTPTGSTWIDLPQNFDLRLVSPQNFHPLPSQWQAITVGWWLTYYKRIIPPIVLRNILIFMFITMSWNKYLFREETNPLFRKVSFIGFSKQRVEWLTVTAFSGSISRDSKSRNV